MKYLKILPLEYSDLRAGKSTLFDIFLKLYTDYEGEIIIDDTNLKDIQDSSFYKDIAYMPQEGVFINDTLEKNFNMLSNVTSDEEFLNILKKLGISDLTSKLQSILGQEVLTYLAAKNKKLIL